MLNTKTGDFNLPTEEFKTMKAARIAKRGNASPLTTPDYSRMRAYEAAEEELAGTGVRNVAELVALINRKLASRHLLPISQGDYPNTRKRLVKLLERWRRLDQ